jgi:hypothetical protein
MRTQRGTWRETQLIRLYRLYSQSWNTVVVQIPVDTLIEGVFEEKRKIYLQ